MTEVRTTDGRVLTPAQAAAHAAIVERLRWPSMHWGAEDLHPDALPHIAIAAVNAAAEQIAEAIQRVRDSQPGGANPQDMYERGVLYGLAVARRIAREAVR